MAPVPQLSPATGKQVPPSYIHTTGFHFRDNHGRALLLRGVNFCSSGKGQPSWRTEGFWDDAEAGKADFSNRPVNLDDGSADEHFARLKAWGYNFLRYVFTWEALEHEGPGKYDHEYIEYTIKVLKKCKEWGFKVFMDPHQDVWSRFSGGSGAPLWTLYACGIDPRGISATFSAFLHHEYPSREKPDPASFPSMIWATNYPRMVSLTVFTMFFAGKAYAPKCIIDGVNIQDWLQNHYLDAVAQLAKRIADEPDLLDDVVIGWDSMNEPGDGLVGRSDLSVVPKEERLKKGPMPSPFQGMRLAMGQPVEVDVWDFSQLGPKLSGKTVLDPKGTKLWLKPEDEETRGGGKWGWKRDPGWQLGTCVWAQHGVWDTSTSALLKRDYFRTHPTDPSRPVEFVPDFWRTHWVAYATRIRQYHPEAIQFIQPPVFAVPPHIPESLLLGRACVAPHYYDGLTLLTRHWNWFNADALGVIRHKYWSVYQSLKVGETAIRNSIQSQLGILKDDTRDVYGSYPTLMGEIGCPFDLDDRRAYGYVDGGQGEGDYSSQQKAWDCSLNAADGPNCLNWTLWTYCPDNSHEWGDNWNGEDLSIWSRDDLRGGQTVTTEGDSSSKVSSGATTRVESVTGSSHRSSTSSDSSRSSTGSTLAPGSRRTYSPKSITDGQGITPALILDGARVPAATCRPYPVKTVGTPDRIDFDIATTRFRFSVRVGSEDESTNEICTELYLPYVHYAASLAGFTASPSSSVNSSRVSLMNGSSARSKKSTTSSTSASESILPLQLNISIKVTKGTYSIEGQTLKWRYPVPTYGEETYSIEVTRKGGRLPRDSGYVPSRSRGLCPSCVIS
ncbi:putative cellulase like glycosyl hydrolase [Kockovaella imperatae]|uniref:Putative cellulase like glycosyl hydrolase n=1 Tax=Kockovaella imperatae TaxID=4999 RepID=A0A1Y1UFT8_9TREE|nr:putative cellulase like glycosyl hydrolase [Kockovaella imperatae]ORX36376.1 putative cellulase like glycosyl hydrolase [Kockovaella imperatae]